jgi:uncharacterized membrane protein YdjX (TVP38/TMEM64 family)
MAQTEASTSNSIWLRLCALTLILGGLSFSVYKFDFVSLFTCKLKMLECLDSLGAWRSTGFIALQAIQVIIAPIPGELTGILGGYLYGPIGGTILSTIGLTIGSYVAFLLARVFGKPLAEKIVPQAFIERFKYLLESKGLFLVFLLFLIPGFPKDYFCYIFGLGAISTMEYLVLSTIGRLLGTILLTLEGSSLKDGQYWMFWTLAAVGLAFGALAIIFRKRLEKVFKRLGSGSTALKVCVNTNTIYPH